LIGIGTSPRSSQLRIVRSDTLAAAIRSSMVAK
jgi:hypothetical protein